MKRAILLLILGALAGSTCAYADDRALANLLAELKRHSNSPDAAPVSVSALGAVEGRELLIKFTLTNISNSPLTLYSFELPWGGPYSITWAAIRGDGRVMNVGYPFDDRFGPGEKTTLAPHQSLNGNYSLSRMLDPAAVPNNTDLAVVWLYSFPAGPSDKQRDTRPFFTGVVRLHTP